jgi:hypothetical protein
MTGYIVPWSQIRAKYQNVRKVLRLRRSEVLKAAIAVVAFSVPGTCSFDFGAGIDED